MGQRDRWEGNGPSWWDVAQSCEHLASEWHVSIELKLGWPVRRLDGKGYSGWLACVTATSRLQVQGTVTSTKAAFGQGGAFKTAPAAFLHALQLLDGVLEEQKSRAEGQARF